MRTRMTVSLLRHNSNYGGCNQEEQHLKRSVCLRKTDSDVADVTRSVANGPKISVLGGHFCRNIYNFVLGPPKGTSVRETMSFVVLIGAGVFGSREVKYHCTD